MFKTIFIVSVGVVGLVEWLKNFLPEKLKDSKYGLAVVSGLISAAAGVGTCLVITKGFDTTELVKYASGTIGLVQVNYNVLLQTFKAVVAKLKESGNAIVENGIDDEIAGLIEDKVSEVVKKALESGTAGTIGEKVSEVIKSVLESKK